MDRLKEIQDKRKQQIKKALNKRSDNLYDSLKSDQTKSENSINKASNIESNRDLYVQKPSIENGIRDVPDITPPPIPLKNKNRIESNKNYNSPPAIPRTKNINKSHNSERKEISFNNISSILIAFAIMHLYMTLRNFYYFSYHHLTYLFDSIADGDFELFLRVFLYDLAPFIHLILTVLWAFSVKYYLKRDKSFLLLAKIATAIHSIIFLLTMSVFYNIFIQFKWYHYIDIFYNFYLLFALYIVFILVGYKKYKDEFVGA
ncbi:MAG: hypothetical protein GY714_12965 [Desulfobacterales bacterium]|nr:hypothetical protein [Desulfobacterales bacterium]